MLRHGTSHRVLIKTCTRANKAGVISDTGAAALGTYQHMTGRDNFEQNHDIPHLYKEVYPADDEQPSSLFNSLYISQDIDYPCYWPDDTAHSGLLRANCPLHSALS